MYVHTTCCPCESEQTRARIPTPRGLDGHTRRSLPGDDRSTTSAGQAASLLVALRCSVEVLGAGVPRQARRRRLPVERAVHELDDDRDHRVDVPDQLLRRVALPASEGYVSETFEWHTTAHTSTRAAAAGGSAGMHQEQRHRGRRGDAETGHSPERHRAVLDRCERHLSVHRARLLRVTTYRQSRASRRTASPAHRCARTAARSTGSSRPRARTRPPCAACSLRGQCGVSALRPRPCQGTLIDSQTSATSSSNLCALSGTISTFVGATSEGSDST